MSCKLYIIWGLIMIAILDKNTIDKIAAGEVIERPASIVKELLENALDSGANAVSIEIKDGGTSLIRVTDNGSGIKKNEIKTAFLRHATSKIKSASDLESVLTLGFRGEALSSIAAISKTEILSKRRGELMGARYCIEGGFDTAFEDVGTPEGTTVIVRDVFFNIPARRKFLKSDRTETAYISELVQKLALSNRNITFKYINNNKILLHTQGNGSLKDIVYQIYGKNAASSILEINYENENIKISGCVGKPEFCLANRNMEIIFINGRYIKDKYVSRGIEDGFADKMMQHKYPFAILYITTDTHSVDINVHPGKLEVRFEDPEYIYNAVKDAVSEVFKNEALIRQVKIKDEKKANNEKYYKYEQKNDLKAPLKSDVKYYAEKKTAEKIPKPPEPFEVKRSADKNINNATHYNTIYDSIIKKDEHKSEQDIYKSDIKTDIDFKNNDVTAETVSVPHKKNNFSQVNFLSEEAKPYHRIVGQLFNTYWIIEFDDKMYFIDQHAAHEKVMYEKFLKQYKDAQITSQLLSPPLIITLSDIEAEAAYRYRDYLLKLGFEFEDFGGKDYSLGAVPSLLPSVSKESVFKEVLSGLSEINTDVEPISVIEKIASMSCKAAVKGNQRLSYSEADKLIDELLSLKNPYNCPHGRPTIIEMTKYDLEKKFKRIV